jgi:hypothetical protein
MRVDYGAGVGVRDPDPLLDYQYQSKRRNPPLTDCRSLRARELTSHAVVAAIERVVAGWVRLTVADPKVSLVMVH